MSRKTKRQAKVIPIKRKQEQADELSYETLVRLYTAEFGPQGCHENFLVEQMAHAQWKLGRFEAIQSKVQDEVFTDANKAMFRKLIAAAKRTYERARKELAAERNKRAGDPEQFGIPGLTIN